MFSIAHYFKNLHWQHHRLWWLQLALLIIVLDQLTKNLALNLLNYNDPVIVIQNWFQFRLLFNSGAAFSFLADAGHWKQIFFFTVGTLVCLILFFWLWTGKALNRLLCISVTLIMGGAIGNLIDRLNYGYVIDFIDVRGIPGWKYIFNTADVMIHLGIWPLVLLTLFTKQEEETTETEGAA